jgi:hypothetical protein
MVNNREISGRTALLIAKCDYSCGIMIINRKAVMETSMSETRLTASPGVVEAGSAVQTENPSGAAT